MLTKEKVEALFLLADVKISGMYEIKNQYGSGEYAGPWWLVKTSYGLIQIGWRKRVINIDWSDTLLRIDHDAVQEYEFHKMPITRDDVTQWAEGVHAYGYAKTVEYLGNIKARLEQVEYANSAEGISALEFRKQKYLEGKEKQEVTA